MSTIPVVAGAHDDPRIILLTAPMSRLQWMAVGTTVALCALDGFDVLAATFAAPSIAREWGLGKPQLGYIFSSGLIGMALGSFMIAPFADALGRRKLTFASLLLMIAGSFWTAASGDVVAMTSSAC